MSLAQPARQASFPLFIAGLSLKQIIAWGTTFYLPSILERQIAAELGLSREVIFGGVTVMLLVAAMIAPAAGRHIDARGARRPMIAGALSLSFGLALLALSQGPLGYLAAWVFFGLAVPLTMSVAAFAAVAQAFPERGRAGITTLMLFGGLSSGVMYPITGWLDAHYGWRATCMIYAALQLAVALPVGHLLIRGADAPGLGARAQGAVQPRLAAADRGRAFWLLVTGTGVSGIVSWGLPLYFVPMFREAGLSASAAILLGASQAYFTLFARLLDLSVSARLGGMRLVSAASLLAPPCFLLMIWGVQAEAGSGWPLWALAVGTAVYGFAAGLIAAGRATLPLELFGSGGFAAMLGRLSLFLNLMFAVSPLLFAVVYDALGSAVALTLALILSLLAAIAFWRLDGLVGPPSR